MADVVATPEPKRRRKTAVYEPIEDSDDMEALSDTDEEMDPAEQQEYYRQLRESDGFDVDYFPGAEIIPQKRPGAPEDIDVALYGRLGLHCYNIQKGTNLQFLCLEKLNIVFSGLFCTHYITLKAMDSASGSLLTFQTCVLDAPSRNMAQLITETEVCRIKPTTPGFEISGRWDDGAVDDFYKGNMPNWDDKLQDCCKVPLQDLDSAGTDRLRLYCEVAFYYKVMTGTCSCKIYTSPTPFELKEVYVQTQENVGPIWNAKNAIFYISFRPGGSARDYKAIVRKTMDGKLGHLRLETNVR